MAYGSRSPHVVGAHFYARYGYEDAVVQISSKLTQADQPDQAFWHKVMAEVENLNAEEEKGRHPCAALPPKSLDPGIKKNGAASRRPS